MPKTDGSAEGGKMEHDHDYLSFLAGKRLIVSDSGVDVPADQLHPALFPFQRDLTRWALRRGRAAIFATTGTGKTLMQLAWAQHAADRVLILAPLAVTQQTVGEGERFGVTVRYARHQDEAPATGITITNYERLDHFDAAAFGAVVLDESSILKSFSGVTKRALVETFRSTPMRLCCTATPAPNDLEELCNHADFLGLMRPNEMRSTFFTTRGGDLRAGQSKLKAHAREAFFRWLASWSMSLNAPSDLGYSDEGYILPPLSVEPVIVHSDYAPEGYLFATVLKGVTHRAQARRGTLAERVEATVQLVRAEPAEPWLIWCGLNDEARAIARRLPGAVNVEGADSPEDKAAALMAFARGDTPVLVTKASIAGFGLNLQVCARMAFCGIGDSFETYYQAIRRCWRFGQTRPVRAYVVLSDVEMDVYNNVLRKESEAREMAADLVAHVAEFERAELAVRVTEDDYRPACEMVLPAWLEGGVCHQSE